MLKSILAFGLTRRAIILLGLLVFIVGGLIAFTRLNIEAYPDPAPVILEITAQAAGLSAEEMERYYTIPMEVGLYVTPGVDNIRSTSFYGLSFVRVTFKYGVDYYLRLYAGSIKPGAERQSAGRAGPAIQQSSLTGEVYRYQIVGPPNFGLTNLRTVQDWIVTRRLYTVPGVVAVNSWGGTTKEYDVDVDMNKLDAYNVTLPQIITALGNANINVGGREITVGQQSVNIRGIGLMDSGGDKDLTQGWHVGDIENVVLAQVNGVPVQVKDVAKVSVGYVPRLGIAGKDHDDDVALAIVVMGRTYHANDVIPRIKAEIEKMNTDGSLPPGVKLVPYYDRTALISVTTKTVLHNLVVRMCAGIYHPVDIPRQFAQRHHRRRQYPVRAVFRRHHHGPDWTGRQSAIGRRHRFRHHRRCRGHSGREYLSEFPGQAGSKRCAVDAARRRSVGRRSDARQRYCGIGGLERPIAAHPRQCAASRQGSVLFHRDHRCGLHSAVHDAGGRRPDFQPDGAHLRLCIGRCFNCDLHGDAVFGIAVASGARLGSRDRRRALFAFRSTPRRCVGRSRIRGSRLQSD